jgi:hypothetical protein
LRKQLITSSITERALTIEKLHSRPETTVGQLVCRFELVKLFENVYCSACVASIGLFEVCLLKRESHVDHVQLAFVQQRITNGSCQRRVVRVFFEIVVYENVVRFVTTALTVIQLVHSLFQQFEIVQHFAHVGSPNAFKSLAYAITDQRTLFFK